jgi:hypothetical protein
MTMADTPEGWYPDPANPAEEIYWTGTSWSPSRRPRQTAPTETELGTRPQAGLPTVPSTSSAATVPITAAGPTPPPWVPPVQTKSRLKLWAMVLAIVALVTAVIPGTSFLTWLFAIPAIVLGVIALIRLGKPRGQALFASIGGAAAWIIAIIVSVAFIAGNAPDAPSGALSTPTSSSPAQESPTPLPTEEIEPVAPAKPPASPYGVYPAAQSEFVSIVETTADGLGDATTDLQRSQLVVQRDADLCALMPANHVDNWVGEVVGIGANGDGFAYVEIQLSPTVMIHTWNNAVSDYQDNTLIKPSEPFFQTLVPMEKGTKVLFSGDFLSESDSCLKGSNLTETFYGLDPDFIFRFSNVAAQ